MGLRERLVDECEAQPWAKQVFCMGLDWLIPIYDMTFFIRCLGSFLSAYIHNPSIVHCSNVRSQDHLTTAVDIELEIGIPKTRVAATTMSSTRR